MELKFYGANTFQVSTKSTTVTVDDCLSEQGAKSVTRKDDAALFSQSVLVNKDVKNTARLILSSAGEYEVGDFTVRGTQARAHTDEEGEKTAVVYQMMYGGTTITFLGHVHPDIVSEVIEEAGGTDILVVPVGGNGYTLDAVGATKLTKEIEPSIVVPSYFEDKDLRFDIPAAPLDDFLKSSGLQFEESLASINSSKGLDSDGSQTQLVVLSKQS